MPQKIKTKNSIQYRTAPAVSDLGDLKKIIKSLEYSSIPYTYLDTRKLKDLLQSGKISNSVFHEIERWKISNGFSIGVGYFSELMYLLKILGIVEDRKIDEHDLDNSLGTDGPPYREFIKGSAYTQELTENGYILCDLLSGDENKAKEYDVTLFWFFLGTKKDNKHEKRLRPIFQFLLEKRKVFKDTDVSIILEEIENDSYTRNAFKKWGDYFNLYGSPPGNPNIRILDGRKVGLRILQVIVIYMNYNYLGEEGFHVQTMVTELSERLGISPSSVNFYNIIETIFEMDNKRSMIGSYTGRGEKTLPHYPRINKIKIQSKIQLFPTFSNLPESKLVSFSNVWGT